MSLHLLHTSTKHLPVQAVAVPCKAFYLTSELGRNTALQYQLLQQIREQSFVPVVLPNGHLEGIFTDFSLLGHQILRFSPDDSLYQGAIDEESGAIAFPLNVSLLLQEAHHCLISLQSGQTVLDAQALLCKTQYALIPIVDEDGRYTGYSASREKIFQLLVEEPVKLRVGGMATPLGVYLTTGKFTSGASWLGLILTGALFGTLLVLLDWLYPVFYSALYAIIPEITKIPEPFLSLSNVLLEYSFVMGGLLLALRLSPISGLHAAEHMTVNAIESGVPLTFDNVSQQPRVHQRCGTNIAVPLVIAQIGFFALESIHQHVSLLGELIFVCAFGWLLWRYRKPIGTWMQAYWTTKAPTARQLASGIAAGKDLLNQYQAQPHSTITLRERILSSGLIQVLIGAAVTQQLGSMLIQYLLKGSIFF